MRVPTALVLPAALALAAALPAPAHAAPTCGGHYTFTASCSFDAVKGQRIDFAATAFTTSTKPAEVAMQVILGGRFMDVIATCRSVGVGVAHCEGSVTAPLTWKYVCRVGGLSYGTYACVTS